MFNLGIISSCNNKCNYCFQKDSHHNLNAILEVDEILKIFEWGKGVERMGILGGEPTLHPECVRICQESASRFPTVFFTNLLCEHKKLENLVKINNMNWLINTTTREELQELFEDNVNYLHKINYTGRCTFGTTLTGDLDQDEKYLKRLARIGKRYKEIVEFFRLAIASPCHDKVFKLKNFDKSVQLAMDIIGKEKLNAKMFFDCSVNSCYLSDNMLLKTAYSGLFSDINLKCEHHHFDLLADRSILFCCSTPAELYDIKDYRQFSNWVECLEYIAKINQGFLKKYGNFCRINKCCRHKNCKGACFAVTANLVKQEKELPLFIQNMHKLRFKLFGKTN